ncbi:hypothetical protein C0Z16_33710 [Paraburkholderia rhynchosiae]|uniref:Uncharacterized protein n=1 Tax=Paraburkholderia rhynchosiae TaxID=487049 RepID=A0ABX4UVV8_9BURK|nr:hypothetical protein C0Z16_33710 [Paraburkholderia rhynchosiae]
MSLSGSSLRAVIEKWIGRTDSVRVTQFSHGRDEQHRFVRVEGASGAALVALIFFRHNDGSWCVFPPERKRPAMNLSL